jgi:thiamine biosynthesis lipoprotein
MTADRAVPAFRLLAIPFLAGALACSQPAPQSQEPAELVVEVLDGTSMGTTYTVRLVTAEVWGEARRERVGGRVQMALDEVESAMSHYQPESEVSRFNAIRSTEPFELSPATFEVVRVALELSELSRGALDITVAPLVNAWGFGPTEPAALPPAPGLVSLLRDRVGFRKLELDEAISTVRKTDPELEWDLSSVAKGYGVDRVAAALVDEGLTRFMVEVGGEIVAAGLNQAHRPWRIGIERPTDGGGIERVVPLSGQALATSGDYRNVREVEGRVVSHTIDPRTGRPVDHQLASVSVIADTCLLADGVATVLAVLGPDEGYDLAVERGWAALFLTRDGDTITSRTTPAFDQLAPPGATMN